jgi:hypothetical protein
MKNILLKHYYSKDRESYENDFLIFKIIMEASECPNPIGKVFSLTKTGNGYTKPLCESPWMERDITDEELQTSLYYQNDPLRHFIENNDVTRITGRIYAEPDRIIKPIVYFADEPLPRIKVERHEEHTDTTDDPLGIHNEVTSIKTIRYENWIHKYSVHQIFIFGDKVPRSVTLSQSKWKVKTGGNTTSTTSETTLNNNEDQSNNETPIDKTYREKKLSINNNNELTSSVKIRSNKYAKLCSSYVYKAGYCTIGSTHDVACVIKLKLPEGVKIACSLGEWKLRVDRCLVVGIFPFQYTLLPYENDESLESSESEDIRWKNLIYTDDVVTEAVGWMFKKFKYIVGQEIVDENFNPDMNATCVPGIHVNSCQEQALEWHGINNAVPNLITGYEYVEHFTEQKIKEKKLL